jgi:hypothetical protein
MQITLGEVWDSVAEIRPGAMIAALKFRHRFFKIFLG